MIEKDVLRDFLDRLLAAGNTSHGLTEDFIIQLELQVRRDWAGERVYIAADPDIDKKRQAAINAVARGAGPNEAASESGLSRRTIYRLLGKRFS